MTSPEHTNRPDNGGDTFTIRGLFNYFTLWLTNWERFDAERDRRYEERHVADEKAVNAALKAAEGATSAALIAQKESVAKTEEAQRVYNTGHNDLSRKMEAQYKETLPRTEADGKFKTQDEKIDDLKKDIIALRLAQTMLAGGKTQELETRSQSNWTFAAALAAGGLIVAVAEFILRSVK